ncbi:unnamed protein product [Strongylus vulgaris]|uniref:Uncharacterized protein n=1 Tax=Strongylus vulgaris TaxID=40348 RepID=A0A3P7IPU1_STRVU|nr:unnamed protein product [Strongylus vulgaris]
MPAADNASIRPRFTSIINISSWSQHEKIPESSLPPRIVVDEEPGRTGAIVVARRHHLATIRHRPRCGYMYVDTVRDDG